MWAGGVAAAVALSCGAAGAELAMQLVDGQAALWEAASAALQAALGSPAHLTDSIQALDAWSTDTGRASDFRLSINRNLVAAMAL